MSARPFRERWYGGSAWWFSADPRALGVFRIMLGILCIVDVVRRWPYIELFFTNNGAVPNHYGLYRPHSTYVFSLLHSFKTVGEVEVFFTLTLVFLVLFTLGWRTRLFQVLSAICMLSIHNRTIITENGGDVVLNLWWLWTIVLPLGRRYSLDAVRVSMRAQVEKTVAALNRPLPRTTTPVWHFAVFAVIWQLVLIYYFNTVHKAGGTWKDGSALAWVYEQDRIVRDVGLLLKDYAPMWLNKALAWGTLIIEGSAVVLLLSPLFTTWCRRITLSLLASLHIGIFLVTDVGLFSPTMIVSYFILLTPPDFALGRRWLTRLAGRPIRVFYDSDCGVCHACARLLRRLDLLERLTFVGRTSEAAPPTGWSEGQLAERREQSIIVDDGQRISTEGRAIFRTLAALPLLRLLVWPLLLPGISHLLALVYGAFARRRHRVSAWLGMGVCGIDGPTDGADVDPAPPAPARARVHARRAGLVVTHALLLTCFAATQSQALLENPWLRKRVKHSQPDWARAVVQYGRFFQGWSMFAPNAPTRDGHLVIDAELYDGRRVDPQTGRPPVFETADARTRRWDQFWGSFSMRIASKRNAPYRDFFSQWLRRRTTHLELGPEDRIKRFKVWWIGDRSPRPGSGAAPVEYERYVVVQFPKGTWEFPEPAKGAKPAK